MPSADAPTTTSLEAATAGASAHAPAVDDGRPAEGRLEVDTLDGASMAPADEAATDEAGAPEAQDGGVTAESLDGVAAEAGEVGEETELAGEPRPAAGEGDGSHPAAAQRPARRSGAQGRTATANRGFPRAERPGNVPGPQHHHLPGWVRRDFARVRPALADLLGLLQGSERAAFQRRVDEITEGISSGKFSLAFQYPDLVTEGRKLYDGQRQRVADAQRAQRQLETARRRAGDKLRDAAETLSPEAAARLQRALRSAGDEAAISEIQAEAQRAIGTARSTQSRRRDREIERTRNQILRTLPKAAVVAEPQTETWQDVLRRFAEEQRETAGTGD